MESQLDRDGAIRSPRLQRHLQSCSKCAAWLQKRRQLEDYLQAPSACPVSPAKLQHLQMQIQEILAHQPSKHSGADAAKRTTFNFGPIVRTAAAIVLLGAGLFGLYEYQSHQDKSGSGALDPSQLVTNSAAWHEQLGQWAGLSEQPIRIEVSNLAADARAGIIFLKNCIPTETPARSDSPPESK
jgi:hypothetical protein